MSAAVMQSAMFDFTELVIKHQHHQQVSLQQLLSSSSGGNSGCSSVSSSVSSTGSSCSSGDLSKLDWESGGGSPPRPGSLAPFILEDLLATNHRKLERTQSEPAPSTAPKSPLNVNTSRYKTELCRPFEESGSCKYGDKCQFAHGEHELRGLVRHPKYKTEPCRTFHTVGFCPYGPRCHFIHNADEARSSPPPTPSPSAPPTPTAVPPAPPATAAVAVPQVVTPRTKSPSPPRCSPPPTGHHHHHRQQQHQQQQQQRNVSSSSAPPLSPEARLPVFNRISAPSTPLYTLHFGELIA